MRSRPNAWTRHLAICAFAATLVTPLPAQNNVVLMKLGSHALFGGKESFTAALQRKLNQLPAPCGSVTKLVENGRFDASLRNAIIRAATCGKNAALFAGDASAREGDLTVLFWKQILPEIPLPTVTQRAMVLVLTQEATDYDDLEWNFCQNKPHYDPAVGQNSCYTNDAKSYITWGPRGATAGHGAEVQQIVAAVDSDTAKRNLIDADFGRVASDIRRMLRLSDADTELFLCAAWIDPVQRAKWNDGFRKFGVEPDVVAAYNAVYDSPQFDGGKIETWFRLYRTAGVAPTEVDYAFFLDRATQASAPGAATIAAAARAMDALGDGRSPAQLRRWIALNARPSHQVEDRLGRDVVFYIDALETSLTPEELAAWKHRNPIRASEAGLDDRRPFGDYHATPLATGAPPRGTEQLTSAERAVCPAAVLHPLPPH